MYLEGCFVRNVCFLHFFMVDTIPQVFFYQQLYFCESGYFYRLVTFVLNWFILLLCHALAEPGECQRIIKQTKRLFVRARTNSHCLFLLFHLSIFCGYFLKLA